MSERVDQRRIPTRRISFEASLQQLPRHFAGGDLVGSHLVAALSAVFPDGEDFFVRSVRRFRDQVTDTHLRDDIAGFIGQEATHGREHRAFNARLAQLGYPTERFARMTNRLLRTREKIAPAKANLAATAALEHFTATLGELILTSDDARAMFGNDEVRDLFVWHALEELEHKAVAFDVYRAVGGGERLRVITMKLLRFGFVFWIGLQMLVSLLRDPAARRRGVLRASWRRFRASPLMDPALRAQLRDYDRPDFHPDDRDTSALVTAWRAELFGEQGSLNDRLVGRVA